MNEGADAPPDPPIGHPPGQRRFGPTIDRFDEAADAWLEQFRGTPAIDRIMVGATRAGEFSAIWHGSSVVRGLVRGRPDQMIGLAVGIGLESLIVNQGLKRLFNRPRPTREGDERFDIRRPLTSSFPSGHASAAGFAATTLIGWDRPRLAPVWALLAATVATSRPYVRIHHASDVIAGVAVGVAMGLGARQIFKRLGLS
ncbi:MAG: phosphatase PAP2 family protein [Ilumatobacteraceae bacterium]